MLILALKGFPVVPMWLHRDACDAGLLDDPIRSGIPFFSETPTRNASQREAGGSESSSEQSERARAMAVKVSSVSCAFCSAEPLSKKNLEKVSSLTLIRSANTRIDMLFHP